MTTDSPSKRRRAAAIREEMHRLQLLECLIDESPEGISDIDVAVINKAAIERRSLWRSSIAIHPQWWENE